MPEKKYYDALEYHSSGKPGKIEVVPTKPTQTKRDLSLAYSPGVAEPCLEISENPENIYKYTAKGNLVAVISNGTAVLGLGDIGAAASKPVITTKFNGASDFFEHGRHGIVTKQPENAQELAEAIVHFTNPNNISAASEAIAEDKLVSNIDINRAAKQLLSLYEKIIERKCKK